MVVLRLTLSLSTMTDYLARFKFVKIVGSTRKFVHPTDGFVVSLDPTQKLSKNGKHWNKWCITS